MTQRLLLLLILGLVSGSFCASIAKHEDDITSAKADTPSTVLDLEIIENPNTKTIVIDSDKKLESDKDADWRSGKIVDITISDSDSSDVPQEGSVFHSFIPQIENSTSDLLSLPVENQNITGIPSKNKFLETRSFISEKTFTSPSTHPETTIINEPVKEESKNISKMSSNNNAELDGISTSTTTAQSAIFTSQNTEPNVSFKDPDLLLQSTFNPTTLETESSVAIFPNNSDKITDEEQYEKSTEITISYAKPIIFTIPENEDHKDSNPSQNKDDVFIRSIQQSEIEPTVFPTEEHNISIPLITSEESREKNKDHETKEDLIYPVQSNTPTTITTLELEEVNPELGKTYVLPPRSFIPENTTADITRLENLLSECERNCKKCNATGKVQNGFCLCFSDNGGEVLCLPSRYKAANIKEETSLQLTSEQSDKEGEGERGQRCSETVGSPTPKGGLRSVLASGLHQLSPEDRVAEFRKRVEALRSRSALARSKYGADDSPTPVVYTPEAGLPVSPFLSQSQPIAVGLSKESTKDSDEENIKIEDITENVNNPQVKLPPSLSVKRSVSNGPNEGSPIIRFLVPELEDRLANVESIGIMGDFTNSGRFQRSVDYYDSSSSEEYPTEYNPLDYRSIVDFKKFNDSEITHKSLTVDSPNNGAIKNLGHNIAKVSRGEMKGLGGILEFSGAGKDVRKLMDKIISKSQDGKMTHEDIVTTMPH